MSRLPKVVVIGCGDWGKNIARTLNKLGALAGICDHHAQEDRLQKIALEFNTPLISLEEALENPDIEAVAIATQTSSHTKIALQALQAQKHVFVEKPLTNTIEDAEKLTHEAEAQKKVLMVGHLLRYHDAFEGLRNLCKEGKLGNLLHINTSRKNLGKIYPHDSVIWDLAPHDLSMVLALFGRAPTRVLASSGNYAVPLHADEACITLSFGQTQRAFITLSRLSPFKEQKVTVVGTQGMAVFDDTKAWDSKLTFFQNRIEQRDIETFSIERDPQGTAMPLEESEPLKNEMQHFLNCINQASSPRTDGTEAKLVLRIIEAAHKSIQDNSWIAL